MLNQTLELLSAIIVGITDEKALEAFEYHIQCDEVWIDRVKSPQVKNIYIPACVTNIDYISSTALEDITVTDIGKNVLYLCVDLVSIVIPRGVTEIKERTFNDTRKLSEITILASVKKVGKDAFSCYVNDEPELTIYYGGKKPLFGLPNGWDSLAFDKK